MHAYILFNAKKDKCQLRCQVCPASLPEAKLLYCSHHLHYSGSHCSGNRAHWWCTCHQRSDRHKLCERSRLSPRHVGDGLVFVAASIIGGPPVIIYSEVIGTILTAKNAAPAVIRIANIFNILFLGSALCSRPFLAPCWVASCCSSSAQLTW